MSPSMVAASVMCALFGVATPVIACGNVHFDHQKTGNCIDLGEPITLCDLPDDWKRQANTPETTAIWRVGPIQAEVQVTWLPSPRMFSETELLQVARTQANLIGQLYYPDRFEEVRAETSRSDECNLAISEFDFSIPFQVTRTENIPEDRHAQVMVFSVAEHLIVASIQAGNVVWKPKNVPFRRIERQILASLRIK